MDIVSSFEKGVKLLCSGSGSDTKMVPEQTERTCIVSSVGVQLGTNTRVEIIDSILE